MSAPGIVLVTGVGQGFGRAIALGWGRAGYDVVCADRDVGLASKTAAEVEDAGGQAIPIQTDVSVGMDVREAFDKVDELFGRLEGVVHVATRTSGIDPRTLADGEFAEVVADTLLSSHLVLRTATRRLENGWVVVVGPPHSGRAPQDRMARRGLAGLVAGYDALDDGPRVNLVLPSRPASDPTHDAPLVNAALFLGSGADGVHGTVLRVELPPPPRLIERLLPEIQAALDDRVRQLDDPDEDDWNAPWRDVEGRDGADDDDAAEEDVALDDGDADDDRNGRPAW
jgi:NAD(P)-dependent dehydrogenase (short-subunit alcohol dehydrogenase family)